MVIYLLIDIDKLVNQHHMKKGYRMQRLIRLMVIALCSAALPLFSNSFDASQYAPAEMKDLAREIKKIRDDHDHPVSGLTLFTMKRRVPLTLPSLPILITDPREKKLIETFFFMKGNPAMAGIYNYHYSTVVDGVEFIIPIQDVLVDDMPKYYKVGETAEVLGVMGLYESFNKKAYFFITAFEEKSTKEIRKKIEGYGKAIESNPQDRKAYFDRGIAWIRIQNWREAIRDFTKVIELDPSCADAYDERGAVAATINDWHRAREDADRAIALDPRMTRPYYIRGNSKYMLKDSKGALQDFKTVIELDSRFRAVYYSRGIVLFNLGDRDGACVDFKKAVDMGFSKAGRLLMEYCR